MHWLKIIKHKKDEKSSPWNTNLIKTPMKNVVLQWDLYKKNKKTIKKDTTQKLNLTPHQVSSILRCTYKVPTKLNETQGERFENISIEGSKRHKEMNQVPHHLKRFASILKNLSIPFSFHTIHIKVRETIFQRVLSLVEVPKHIREITIISQILLGMNP